MCIDSLALQGHVLDLESIMFVSKNIVGCVRVRIYVKTENIHEIVVIHTRKR